jgi:hypothetical protein
MDEFIFPPFEVRTKKISGKTAIFDIIRKKFIILTPEEWVRQHLVHFLINRKKYPKSLITVEDGLSINKMHQRSDVVVFDRSGSAFLVAECKSAKITLNQKTMDQLSAYNRHYRAKYLMLTNGVSLIVCGIDYDLKQANFLDEIPDLP